MSGVRDTTGLVGPEELSSELVVRACLTIVNGKGTGQVFTLPPGEAIIGRGVSAHVRVDDKPVSSQHAKIIPVGDGHQIIDLGSTNGTFLNGDRLKPNEPTALTFGDSIQVAETVLAYVPNTNNTAEHTQHLSLLAPQFPGSDALRLPEAQALAQLLQTAAVPTGEPRAPTLDEQLDKLLKAWAVVKRNRGVLLVSIVVCALIGNVSAFLKPPPSDATVRVRLTPKTTENPLERPDRFNNDDENFYEAAAQSFTAAPLVASTLTGLGEKPNQWRMAQAMSSLKFERMGTGLYLGTFTNNDPEYAVKFLSRHVKGYLESEVQKKLQVVQARVDFLKNQLAERDAELRKTEDELKKFKDQNIDGLPELAQSRFASREELHMRRAELSAQLAKTNLELNVARKRLADEAPMLAKKVAGAAPFQDALVDVKRRLSEARGKGLGDQHPEVVALKSQAAELERLADQATKKEASELERGADPGLIQLKHRVADLEVASKGTGAELGEVNAELSRLNAIVKDMPEVEAKYAQLTRSYAASKEVHGRLFGQLKTSELDLEIQRTSAKAQYEVVAAPESLPVPMRRTLALRTIIGIVVGLVIGALIATARELRAFMKGYRKRRMAIVPVGGPR